MLIHNATETKIFEDSDLTSMLDHLDFHGVRWGSYSMEDPDDLVIQRDLIVDIMNEVRRIVTEGDKPK